jgi:hypothetical protein
MEFIASEILAPPPAARSERIRREINREILIRLRRVPLLASATGLNIRYKKILNWPIVRPLKPTLRSQVEKIRMAIREIFFIESLQPTLCGEAELMC